MEQIVYKNVTKTERATTLTVREVSSDLFAYAQTSINESRKDSGTFDIPMSHGEEIIEEGFVDKVNLKAMLAGKSFKKAGFFFMTLEDKANYRSMFQPERIDFIVLTKNKKNIFQQIDAGLTENDLVYYDLSRDLLYNHDGKCISRTIIFDYIDAGMHERRYDLKLAVDILLERNDIRLFSKTRWGNNVDTKNLATNADSAIIDIPSYNQFDGEKKYICFAWSASDDDFNAMVERAKVLEPKCFTIAFHTAVLELDLLGLKNAEKIA